jgi:small subunit ribosomal protein S21
MSMVIAKPNEHADALFRRFKRSCERSGIVNLVKQKAHYIKPTKKRSQERIIAKKRLLRFAAKVRVSNRKCAHFGTKADWESVLMQTQNAI